MIRTVVYVCMNADYRESAQNTSFHSFFNTFTNCRDVFLRNSTTNNCGFELVQFFSVGIHRLEFNFTVTILSTTTRLFSIFAVDVYGFSNSLFVCNLRSTYVSLYFEFTKQTVNDDFQMQLTHTSDNGLTSFLIGVCTEGRILLSQFCKGLAQFALACFCLRLDSQLDNRFREFHRLKDYRMLVITDCITSCGEFETDCCSDISRIYFIQFHTFVSVHLKDTANTFFLVLSSVEYVRTRIHSTGVYTEVCQFTNKWVCHNLECQSGEWFFIRRMSHDRVAFQVNTLDWRNVCWSRHEFNDCIQKLLNTLVSVCSTAAYRYSCTFASSFTKNCF